MKAVTPWLLALSLQLPALRALARYAFPFASGLGLALLLAAAVAAAGELYRRSRPASQPPLLARRSTFLALVAATALAAAAVYPLADGLKHQLRGSDSDDALVVAAEGLVAGRNPYLGRTYFGLPLSPGPGWVLLWAPLALAGVQHLGTPALLLAVGLALRRRSWRPANLFLLALASSLGFWEILAVGGDQLAIGLAVVLAVLAARRLDSTSGAVAAAVFAGFVATARLTFCYFPAVLGWLVAARDRRRGLLAGAVGTAVCAGLHLLFYAWGPGEYGPLHLVAKGGRIVASPWAAAALVAAAAAAAIVLGARCDRLDRWLLLTWASLWLPLLAVAAADLAAGGFRFRHWEGASYLLPPMPVFAAFFAVRGSAADR